MLIIYLFFYRRFLENMPNNFLVIRCKKGTVFLPDVRTLSPTFSKPFFSFGMYFRLAFLATRTGVAIRLVLLLRLLDLRCLIFIQYIEIKIEGSQLLKYILFVFWLKDKITIYDVFASPTFICMSKGLSSLIFGSWGEKFISRLSNPVLRLPIEIEFACC